MKLSVCMITFNQEKYIAQAIDSVLMQDVDFEYEIVIGDDCSADGTIDILRAYQQRFPEKIKLLLNKKNLGVTENFAQTLKACSGEYVALLEGDDYWTSSSKLRKQVDFLDLHPDYITCFHSTRLVDRAGKVKLLIPRAEHKKPTSGLIDLIRDDSFMATCSIVFRNKAFDYFPDVFYVWKSGCDWPLNVLNAEHGPIGFIDEVMSNYRSGSGEFSWTSKPLSEIMSEAVKFNLAFNAYFNYRYDDIFKLKISLYYYVIAIDLLRQQKFSQAISSLNESFKLRFNPLLIVRAIFIDGPKSYLRGWLDLHMPKTFSVLKSLRGRA